MLVQDGLPPHERRRALWVIILGILVTALDGTIVNLALPDITRELNATAAQSLWIINAYQIAILALLLPLATLGDVVGYRRVYLVGMAIFTLASVVCTFADSLTTLALARGLQGLGAAGIMSVNSALVRLTYPRHLLGRGIALNSMVVAGGTVAGPSIAAAVLSVASWPWLFAINLPIGLFCLALGSKALPRNLTRADGSRISKLDVVLNILMFSLVVLGVDGLGVRSEGQGTSGPSVPMWLAASELTLGIAIGIFYVRRQLKQPLPLFPVDLLRIPVFALSMCTSIGAFCAQMLAYVGLPFLLLETYGRTHLEAGLLLTAWPIGIVLTALFVGRLIDRHSGGLLGGAGLGLMALGLALLALLPAHPSSTDIVWRMLICGMGFGLFQSPNNHIILTSAPAHRAGGAGGMVGTARLTGQILGAVLLAMIFGLYDPHDGKGPLIALWLAAAFAAVAGIFSALRIRHL
jgi:DHA2 family multidrug resistance protein-like MFS transporter